MWENYQVWAYDDLIGHGDLIQVLRGAVQAGRISHAYLFGGPGGVGKTTTARIFARALLCPAPHLGEACGQCRSCLQFSAGHHPDFQVLVPDGKSIKIAQIRQLQKDVALRPYQGRRLVYLIKKAEAMTRDAANSFLKTLEEPPAGVIFILLTNLPQFLLPTISSRCQQINFKLLPDPEVAAGLFKLKALSAEESRLPVALAGGRLGRALEMLEDKQERDRFFSLLSRLDGAPAVELVLLAGEMAKPEVNWPQILDMLFLWYRDLLIWNSGLGDLIINQDRAGEIAEWAAKIPPQKIIQNMKAVDQAQEALKTAVNTRLLAEDLFFSLAVI